MPYPRVIPHSDAAGVVDSVGVGVDPTRVGRRVWVYGAQSYRPFGTAAQLTVVPTQQVIDLPNEVSDEVGACLGIPGITAHRTVFADGRSGSTVLVQGVLGAVGSLAAQLAHWGGATVIGTVRRSDDLSGRATKPSPTGSPSTRPTQRRYPGARSRRRRPHHRSRLLDNIDLDAAVAKNHTVIAAYATRGDRPDFPFWPMLFDNIVIRLLGSDDFPAASKHQAALDLTAAARDGALSIPIGTPLPLERAAEAHDRVDAGGRDRSCLPSPIERPARQRPGGRG